MLHPPPPWKKKCHVSVLLISLFFFFLHSWLTFKGRMRSLCSNIRHRVEELQQSYGSPFKFSIRIHSPSLPLTFPRHPSIHVPRCWSTNQSTCNMPYDISQGYNKFSPLLLICSQPLSPNSHTWWHAGSNKHETDMYKYIPESDLFVWAIDTPETRNWEKKTWWCKASKWI